VLGAVIDERLPAVGNALQRTDVQLRLFTSEWFLALFCSTLPMHTVVRVWDALFLYGGEAIFRVAVTLLWLNRESIATADGDFVGMFAALRRCCSIP